MAYSSSSSSVRNWKYHVFVSFYGPDVRKTFLSHFRKQCSFNGITMFDDHGIERSHNIAPAIIQAIRESRISIVVFSKEYASSSWSLTELGEISNCMGEMGQLMIPIYYGVDPSDVRKKTGDFGKFFKKTCAGKTEDERKRWTHALTNAASIVGQDFRNWDNEANMIENIAKDISNKLNVTPNKDFEDKVGIEAHLHEMESLLQLDLEVGAMIVGIWGPAGVGKTTIARALHSRLTNRFQLTCFMENLKGVYNSGLDDYGSKLRLQEQLLSKILNQNDMRIYHLGAIRERLGNLKVLIILDDVDDPKQLEALANEIAWFGPGSRIIVTTKDQELLRHHGIDRRYHMGFPCTEEALEILSKNAFRQTSPPGGFKELAKSVVELCGNLPSRLCVVGSTLRGKSQGEWEEYEQSLSNKQKGKGKSRCSTGMTYLVIINLLVEIASAISDQLSSLTFARISLAMSVLSVVLSILDLIFKIRVHKACFQCKGTIPWFYYPPRRYNKILGNVTDTVLLCCVVLHLASSGINYSFINKGQDAPIKVLVWPLVFAIGMVISKFMEKLAKSDDMLPIYTKSY